ncbi:hypothetical protein QET40_03250 [Akkermansia sp. N21169]|jgi:hypothetical protein|uniref:hypothetical protein n=1 Tax=Akkermansia sp. N21169 TaxID=3040765 RepID=UPI00244E872A|nr:hypothetical protein [Akkermansia sp. N21169]MDH3068120.1 hypothetical protein [Akkermansia sp. N21169]
MMKKRVDPGVDRAAGDEQTEESLVNLGRKILIVCGWLNLLGAVLFGGYAFYTHYVRLVPMIETIKAWPVMTWMVLLVLMLATAVVELCLILKEVPFRLIAALFVLQVCLFLTCVYFLVYPLLEVIHEM